MKRANPEKNCFLEYDRLYIDHKIYVYNDVMGQVVEMSEAQKFSDMFSRPGTQMLMYPPPGGGRDSAAMGNIIDPRFLGPSRPPSGMSSRVYVMQSKSTPTLKRCEVQNPLFQRSEICFGDSSASATEQEPLLVHRIGGSGGN